MFKWIFTVVILLAVAGIGGGLWWSYSKANAQNTAPQATGTVERGTLRISVSTTGKEHLSIVQKRCGVCYATSSQTSRRAECA